MASENNYNKGLNLFKKQKYSFMPSSQDAVGPSMQQTVPLADSTNWGVGSSMNSSVPNTGINLGVSTPITWYPTEAQWNANLTANPIGGGFTGAQSVNAWDSLFDTKGTGGFALDALKTGTGAFNAWMGMKNQKFLEKYYGAEQARATQDFNNNAITTNDNLRSRERTRLSQNGIAGDTAESNAALDKYMGTWGVKGI